MTTKIHNPKRGSEPWPCLNVEVLCRASALRSVAKEYFFFGQTPLGEGNKSGPLKGNIFSTL